MQRFVKSFGCQAVKIQFQLLSTGEPWKVFEWMSDVFGTRFYLDGDLQAELERRKPGPELRTWGVGIAWKGGLENSFGNGPWNHYCIKQQCASTVDDVEATETMMHKTAW